MKSDEASMSGPKKVKRESDDETVRLEDDIEEDDI